MTRSDRQFETSLQIQAPRAAVWQALVEAREIARWFAPDVTSDNRVGGRLVWRWGDLHTWAQTIEVLEPGQHLRTRYDSTVADGRGGLRPLFVDFHLEGDRGTTTLRLVHSGFGPEADFDGEYHGISSGWPVELRSLQTYLERHRGRDRLVAWSTAATTTPPAAAWQRLVGPDGLAAPDLTRRREGEAFTVAIAGGEPIRGTTLFVPTPREFSGLAASHGDGWLRVHCEHWGGATRIWLWLATYDGDRARSDAMQRTFDATLQRLFAAQPAAAERTA